jgi:hypothetical protein
MWSERFGVGLERWLEGFDGGTEDVGHLQVPLKDIAELG